MYFYNFKSYIVTPPPQDPYSEILDDPMAAISKGFGWLSSTAANLGSTLHEKVIQPTTNAINDPEFQQNMNSYMNSLKTTVVDAGQSGLNMASSGVNMATKWMNDQGLSPTELTKDDIWNQTTPISPEAISDPAPYNLKVSAKKEKQDYEDGWQDF